MNPNKNKVAVITGASSGIGHALALECVKAGYDILAIGRDHSRLNQLKQECPTVNIYTLSLELTHPDATTTIINYVKNHDLKIGLLVNNAGFGLWGAFSDLDLIKQQQFMQLAINFYLSFTQAMIPFLAHTQGKILNIGSVYSYIAVPQQSLYAASKAFLLSHTLALRSELAKQQITVSICCPGITTTAFRTRSFRPEKMSWLAMSATQVARYTLKKLKGNPAVIIPGMHNQLFVWLCRILPTALLDKLIKTINHKRQVHQTIQSH